VSPDIRSQIRFELEQLHKLLDQNQNLIQNAQISSPSGTERSALALMLQSFYTGFENIFNRIAKEIDGGFKKTEHWHVELLDKMASSNHDRPAVISEPLKQRLHLYLGFRHISRSIYSFDLHWDKMKDLVAGCQETLSIAEAEFEILIKIIQR
jgi:hypothetical protein